MYTVYILRTSSDTLYIGQTQDLQKRLTDHREKTFKAAKYMRYFQSFDLVYTEEYVTRSEAMKREYQLKSFARKQKEALISSHNQSSPLIQYGASFSHPYLNFQSLDIELAFKAFKSLHLPWIRLGCYWNEIETIEGEYAFDKLDQLVSLCAKANINVLLTVGMKAPRWPEYYLPDWTINQISLKPHQSISINDQQLHLFTLRFIKECATHFKNSKAVKIWQVENEPLDPSGPQEWRINSDFLIDEVNLIKHIDPNRKILINLWGNELTKRKYLPTTLELADIIGLDLYLRVPSPNIFSKTNYKSPNDSPQDLLAVSKKIKDLGKELWITEIQTEPWENQTVHTPNPPSFLPKHFAENIDYVTSLHPSHIFMWGFEWWYQQKTQGNSAYWDEVTKYFRQNSTHK